jgi:pimeloyl-ACP methyl ester carboxylesterase
MKQFFKTINGVRIEFLESKGEGLPVFIFHGNSGSASAYESLMKSAVGKKHRVISVSFPGHGNSEYLVDDKSSMSIQELGDFANKVVSSFKVEKYILIGQSLGGHALLEALEDFSKAIGMILVSAPPISLDTLVDAFSPDPTDGLLFKADLDDVEVGRFADAFIHQQSNDAKTRLMQDIKKTNGRFREALGNSLSNGLLQDEIKSIKSSKLPVLIIYGENDQFIESNYYTRFRGNARYGVDFSSVSNCGHAVQLEKPEQFENLIETYIQLLLQGNCNNNLPMEEVESI